MSKGINKWHGIGNCCADPDTRYSPSGAAITNVTVACNNNYKNKAGEQVDATEFVRVVFFNRLAEVAGEYLRKGSKVYIEGSLRTRKWQDKATGADRYTTEIVASEMQMLDSKKDSGGEQYHQPEQAPQQAGGFDDFSDDIPF